MLGGTFGVLRVGGALEHGWGVSWCLEAWSIGGVQVLIDLFVMLECKFDAFEWWFELVECVEENMI